ncbi:MAG: DUF3971 domain-containing protein [Gammaproteobacteria bacterium]|nr:DUF3971 domain-containing protein [Gammaproteobacteria bacterium]
MKLSDKTIIQIRRSIIYAIAIFVVTSAVMLSIARVILPQVQGYRENIQLKLGEIIGKKVTLDSIDARLVGLTPTLIFKGFHLYDNSGDKEIVAFKEVHLGISVIESISRKALIPKDLSILGTKVYILQKEDGSFLLQGVDIVELVESGQDSVISEELAKWLMEQTSLKLDKSTIVLKLKKKKSYTFNNVNLTIKNRLNRHQLTGSVELPERVGKQANIAMDITGDLLKPAEWAGLVYLESKEFRLSSFGIQPQYRKLKIIDGVSAFSLWGEWENGIIQEVSGDVSIKDVEVANNKTNTISRIDQLNAKFDWFGKSDNWKLQLADIEFKRDDSVWKESSVYLSWENDKDNNSKLDFNLEYAKLDDIKPIIKEFNLIDDKHKIYTHKFKPTGEIHNLNLSLKRNGETVQAYSVAASLTDFGISPTDNSPGVFGVNAQLNLNEEYGYLEIDTQQILFNYPKLFRYPVTLSSLKTRLDFLNTDTGWLIKTDNISAANNELEVSAGMMMYLPVAKKASYLDFNLSFGKLDLTKIYKYQPTAMMKEKLVKWIDESFIAGTVNELDVAYRGWSNRFPFRQYSGVLNGSFHTTNVEMHYFPGWPQLEGLEARGEFTNVGIKVKALKASIHGGDIQNLVVTVEDFKKPILVAKGDAYSTTHNGFNFFAKTPVGKRSKRFVSKTIFKGDIHTNMTFSVALDKDLAKTYKKRFSGYVETKNSELHMMHNRMPVTDIQGKVYFSDKKHHGEDISAKLLGGPAKIRVSSKIIGIKPVATVHGEGKFDAVMLDRNFKKLGLMRIYGTIPWQGEITLGHQKSVNSIEREPAKMWLKSDLAGVEIDLPEPYRKPPEIARPTMLKSTFLPEIKTILNIQYGDRMSTEMRVNNNYFPARIEIGEMKLSAGKAKLPDKDEFRLSGVVNNADQYKWREVMQEHYNKYRKLRTRPIVDVPVIVDFAYVSVPFDKEKAKPRKRYTSPVIMPAFKGQVREFVFAGKKIGKVEFDSRKDKLGLVFDRLSITSPEMKYSGTMTWHYINNWHKTKALGKFTINNAGKLTERFGFPDKVKDGEGTISINFNWDNPFYVFRPGYTNGRINIKLEDGIVTAINPGAGRFLGLLNISTLPRRLLLDFKDAGSGFAFDEITGNIDLKNGVAKTTDLSVDSTIADILAVGKVDLRNKKLDQVVTVTPQIAGTMPVVSGLLMGTGVIPLVWLFERMFGSDMDRSLSRQYHISGPWSKPAVVRLDKDEDEDEEF